MKRRGYLIKGGFYPAGMEMRERLYIYHLFKQKYLASNNFLFSQVLFDELSN